MKKITTRGAEYVMSASFEFDVTDTMDDVDGNEVALGASGGNVFEAVKLPPGSQVIGGDVTVLTASNDTGISTLTLGDETTANRYADGVNLKSAGRSALTLTGFQNDAGESLRATVANANGNATTGRVKITVQYISDRINEAQSH